MLTGQAHVPSCLFNALLISHHSKLGLYTSTWSIWDMHFIFHSSIQYLCGQVERPEDESQHAAREHGKHRECKEAIPLAVVLHVLPDLHRYPVFHVILQTFHPDSGLFCIPAGPTLPPSEDKCLDRPVSGVFLGVYPTRPEAEDGRRVWWNVGPVSHWGAHPVWEEAFTNWFPVEHRLKGLSLSDANSKA